MSAEPLLPDPASAGFRDRLLAGMADAIREHGGYRPVTVAEVVRRARTSRRTFYQHFEDRDACFLALFDVVSERLLAAVGDAATGEGPTGERIDRAMAAYLGALTAEPALTRASIEEVPALGPAGAARVRAMQDRGTRQLMRLVEEAGEHDPAVRPLSYDAATIVTAGLRDLVLLALEQGRDPLELLDVAGEVFRRVTMR